jgi:hypothetical protein
MPVGKSHASAALLTPDLKVVQLQCSCAYGILFPGQFGILQFSSGSANESLVSSRCTRRLVVQHHQVVIGCAQAGYGIHTTHGS